MPTREARPRPARVGLSLAGLRTTGMWGEPRDRAAAVATIRLATALGVRLVEVPVPFGSWADLLREAGPDPGSVILVARLTGADPGRDLAAARARLGQPLAARIRLVLARPDRLEEARAGAARMEHPPPVGVWVTTGSGEWPGGDPAAVRGPAPTPWPLVDECERRAVPYLGADPDLLAGRLHTVVLLEPSGPAEMEGLHARVVTPPAAGPG